MIGSVFSQIEQSFSMNAAYFLISSSIHFNKISSLLKVLFYVEEVAIATYIIVMLMYIANHYNILNQYKLCKT